MLLAAIVVVQINLVAYIYISSSSLNLLMNYENDKFLIGKMTSDS